MRSILSVVVLASALVLLVPDNGAQAVNAAEAFPSAAAASSHAVAEAPSFSDRRAPGNTDAEWLLALGFLGAVMARRLRPE